MTKTSVKLFYFGAWDQAGHYLRDQSHRILWPDNDKIGPWRIGELDGGLQPKDEKQVEGIALLHHLDGWTALAFWDRTVDHRMASCSVYVATGTHSFEEMVALAQDGFKARWDRMKFEVRVVQEKRADEPECDCLIPALEGAGQHSPSCAIFKRRRASNA